MAVMFTNWLKNTFKRKDSAVVEKCRCEESEKCMEILQLLIDGEADNEQEAYFLKHIETCMPCYQYYNLEKAIKEILKTKIERKPVPQDLVNTIKLKIKETV